MSRGGAAALLLLAGLGLGGCAAKCERKPTVLATEPNFARWEAPDAGNACTADVDCLRTGCGGEVCAAMPLEAPCPPPHPGPIGDCGCVNGSCRWYSQVCDATGP